MEKNNRVWLVTVKRAMAINSRTLEAMLASRIDMVVKFNSQFITTLETRLSLLMVTRFIEDTVVYIQQVALALNKLEDSSSTSTVMLVPTNS